MKQFAWTNDEGQKDGLLKQWHRQWTPRIRYLPHSKFRHKMAPHSSTLGWKNPMDRGAW